MAINTTKTLEKTSNVLGSKCDATQKNMEKLMREAGCCGAALEKVTIPQIPGCKDDVVFAGLNGVSFYFMRGKCVQMPAPVKEILRNAGVIG
ncbi:MAG: hypothetical protein IKU73_01990 [Clostridia bacterium]|nr:hypothetical protein [Clostridia bacterium]